MANPNILAFFSIILLAFLIFGCAQPQPPPPVFEEPETPPQPEPAVNDTNATNQTDFGTEEGSIAIIEDEPEFELNETTETNGANATTNETNATNETLPTLPIMQNDTRPASSNKISEGTFGIEYQPDSPLYIYFIDVGFGDSILVKKGSFAMLVDGGDLDHGLPVVSFIGSQNISRLQAIVATYAAAEHIGGLPVVLRAVPADEFWDNKVRATSEEFTSLYAETYDKAMPIKWPAAGDSLEVNGMRIDILNPQLNRFGTNPQTDAVAMILTYKSFCAVLLSDAPEEIDPLLIGSGGGALDCDVVKLTNHGSGRSSEMLLQLIDRISPKAAIISVGTNSEGLPNPTTITRMQLKQIPVWRTDLNGTITVSSNGTGYAIAGSK
jgi:competence protein ComEC